MSAYATVTIDSNVYSVYEGLDAANAYLDASVSAQGTAWRAADTTTQSRGLVSAVRWLDTARWLGSKTDPTQELAFPRTGLVDASGTAIDHDTIPDQVFFAEFELAAALLVDPDLRITISAPGLREHHAGTVGESFFKSFSLMSFALFPESVMALIGLWLEASVGIGAPQASGVDRESDLNQSLGFTHGI